MDDEIRSSYPTGADVVIQPGDPVHPGGDRPATAMAMYVSAVDQQWIDDVRARSYQLAIARGHLRVR